MMNKCHMYGRSLDTDGNDQEPLAWLQGIEYQECHGVLSSRNQEICAAHGSYCQGHIL